MSDSVLDSLSNALQSSAYLLRLAGPGQARVVRRSHCPERVRPPVLWLMDSVTGQVTIIVGRDF